MKIEFCMGTPEDRQDILDFGDLVFSKNGRPHDFQTLLPKLYGPKAAFEPLHYLVKENGKIRAMICVLPMEYRVGNRTLKCSGVGTVSVHPMTRGRGYMKKLMAWAMEDMQKRGEAFSVLGGLRQRYEYYGYTPAGTTLQYSINRDNLRHRYRGRDFAPVCLSPMTQEQAVAFATSHAQRSIGVVRKEEEFLDILRSWNAVPYTVLLNEKAVGYFCCSGGHIGELQLDDASLLPDVLHAVAEQLHVEEIFIPLPAWETALSPELGHLSEDVRITADHNYRIFDFPAVVEAFLTVQAGYTPLPDGTLSFAIENGQRFAVTVKDGVPAVSAFGGETPDFQLKVLEAIRLFFAPEGWREIPHAGNNALVRAWFPLPLHTPEPDNC